MKDAICCREEKGLMAKVTLHCWRNRFFRVCATAVLAGAENFT